MPDNDKEFHREPDHTTGGGGGCRGKEETQDCEAGRSHNLHHHQSQSMAEKQAQVKRI